MALIGNLAIGITANASGFTTGINRALSVLNGFKSAVTSTAGKIVGITAGMAGVAGAAGMGMLVKDQMEAVDSAAKLSDKLGMDLQQLRGLQYAAEMAGASTETFNNSLEMLNRNFGDAINGSNTARASFTNLGINLQSMTGSSVTTLFKQVSDRISALPSPAQRASAAMDVFGKSYAGVMNFIETGSSDMDRMIDRFGVLSGSLSRVDAAKIEIANDKLTEMKIVVEGLAAKIGVELAPYIDGLIEKLINLGANGKNASNLVVSSFEWIATAIAKASDYVQLFSVAWHGVRWAIDNVARHIVSLLSYLQSAFVELGRMVGVSLSNPLSEWANELGVKERVAFRQAADAWSNFRSGANSEAVGTFFQDIRTKSEQAAQAIAKAADAKKEFASSDTEAGGLATSYAWMDKMKQLGANIFEQTRTPLEKFKAQIEEAAQAFQAGFIDSDTFGRYGKMLQDTLFPNQKAEHQQVGSFASIDNSRFALATSSQKNQTQKVSDPQLERTNQLLARISNNMGIQAAVAQ
jgi:hypothetical protein